MTAVTYSNTSGRKWQIVSFILLLISIGLLIALIVVAVDKNNDDDDPVYFCDSVMYPTCGDANPNPNGHFVDLSEPQSPGPFHDLTTDELIKLRTFLMNDPDIHAVNLSNNVAPNDSYIFLADVWVPPKAEVLQYLDQGAAQPPRQARVMMYRGDKTPPVVEELICGPLPDVTNCSLMDLPNRRNPVEYETRPLGFVEGRLVFFNIILPMHGQIGHILTELYGTNFMDCEDERDCLTFTISPFATGLSGNINHRRFWLWALYNTGYYLLHPTDFGVLLRLDGGDPTMWGIEKVWFAGILFDGLEEFAVGYNSTNITRPNITKPIYSNELYSSLERRGQPRPENPQRAPTQVEPDGKRYTLNQRKVEYMGWEFNFRMSPFSGPILYDIKFQGERIVYELAIAEIVAYYSGNSPLTQHTDYVDSGALSGLGSKSMVPGGDCPDTATLVNYTFMNQHANDPGIYDSVFCLFEHNNNYPLRRHLEYYSPTGFYGGMLDSVLTLRSALTVGNYDYIIDFIFHQNGALETRLMSTGYILSNVFREVERLYGFQIENGIIGNIHHHIFHLKADLDINGVSNRYETLNIERENTTVTWNTSIPYHQTKFTPSLKETELDALYQYNFENPREHIAYNDAERTAYGEKRAFRIHLSGMSKSLFAEGEGNEPVISWARNQIAVTKHKDEEFLSSSMYAMYDSMNPVVDFSRFYSDNETIVDEDLVFWLTLGLHHIPHSEDLPVVPTAGNHLTAFLLPYNYFPEDPSMGSRDAIYVSYKDIMDSSKGVNLERYGNSRDVCTIPQPTLEEDLEANPDQVLESRRPVPSV